MSDWASLDGSRVVSARVTIPYYGAWTADVMVSTDGTIPTNASLVLGNLTLVGAALRQGAYAGAWYARLVAGYGGWQKFVKAQSYKSDTGILRSLLLKDAAAAVGEKISVSNDSIVGQMYVRESAPASRILTYLAGTLWFIDPAGVTQVGVPRLATPITSQFEVTAANPAKGSYTVATDALTDWTPGRTFTAPTVPTPVTIGSVTHVVSGEGQHRIEVLSADAGIVGTPNAPTPASRISRALDALIRGEFPQQTYFGLWDYTVQDHDGNAGSHTPATKVDAVPIDGGDVPLPDIVGAPFLPGLMGERIVPAIGSTCIVAFRNGDPKKPVVIAGDYDNAPAFVRIAGGTKKAARKGDAISAGTLTVGGAAGVTISWTPPGGVPTTPGPTVSLTGLEIDEGSDAVEIP